MQNHKDKLTTPELAMLVTSLTIMTLSFVALVTTSS